MSTRLSFTARLYEVLIPTPVQVVGALLISVILLVIIQTHIILMHLGLPVATLTASQGQFNSRFNALISSPVTAQAALVTFWAIVGLVAYLVCWGVYNVFVEARNEVTLSTEYTNRGHWRGPYETLTLKAVSGLCLGIALLTLWHGVSFWIALAGRFAIAPSASSSLFAALAVLGFAVQLYLVLVLIQLTFTPWYRPEAFTQA
jgi:hypothetical protein